MSCNPAASAASRSDVPFPRRTRCSARSSRWTLRNFAIMTPTCSLKVRPGDPQFDTGQPGNGGIRAYRVFANDRQGSRDTGVPSARTGRRCLWTAANRHARSLPDRVRYRRRSGTGDVVFFHFITSRGSNPNRSDRIRKTVLCQQHYDGRDSIEPDNNLPNERLVLSGRIHIIPRKADGAPSKVR